MKSGWQYIENEGTNEKIAPYTLMDNVFANENGGSMVATLPMTMWGTSSRWIHPPSPRSR